MSLCRICPSVAQRVLASLIQVKSSSYQQDVVVVVVAAVVVVLINSSPQCSL